MTTTDPSEASRSRIVDNRCCCCTARAYRPGRRAPLALWEPTYGGSQYNGYNDFDSVEVGNCNDPVSATSPFGHASYTNGDGLTYPERQTVLSLWSLASSPLILGTDLTQLCPQDLNLLENKAVIALDQDGIDASLIETQSGERVVAKTTPSGAVAVGLFNTGLKQETLSVAASAIGLPASSTGYTVDDLWSGTSHNTTSSTFSQIVPSHGVALFEITPSGS